MFPDYLQILRPKQWTKNVFVLLPILFGEVWKNGQSPTSILVLSGAAFVAFCAWSSAGYILNDVLDRRADAAHPRKKNRPIASGRVPVGAALALSFVLAVGPIIGLLLMAGTAFPASRITGTTLPASFHWVTFIGAAYLLNTVLYCVWVKKQVLLDVFSIALGFVLRVLAGCAALGLVPSNWILVCTFSLAIFLGFGKRRMEIACLVPGREADFRAVLAEYPREYLDFLLGVSGTVSLMAYLLYTLSPETFNQHQTHHLIYSVPFVFYGIFRYTRDAMSGQFDGPDEVLLRDRPFLICGLLWAISVVWILKR